MRIVNKGPKQSFHADLMLEDGEEGKIAQMPILFCRKTCKIQLIFFHWNLFDNVTRILQVCKSTISDYNQLWMFKQTTIKKNIAVRVGGIELILVT